VKELCDIRQVALDGFRVIAWTFINGWQPWFAS